MVGWLIGVTDCFVVDPPAAKASALVYPWCFVFLFVATAWMARLPCFGATDLVVPTAAREYVCWARRPRGVPPSPRIASISVRLNTNLKNRDIRLEYGDYRLTTSSRLMLTMMLRS